MVLSCIPKCQKRSIGLKRGLAETWPLVALEDYHSFIQTSTSLREKRGANGIKYNPIQELEWQDTLLGNGTGILYILTQRRNVFQ